MQYRLEAPEKRLSAHGERDSSQNSEPATWEEYPMSQ